MSAVVEIATDFVLQIITVSINQELLCVNAKKVIGSWRMGHVKVTNNNNSTIHISVVV